MEMNLDLNRNQKISKEIILKELFYFFFLVLILGVTSFFIAIAQPINQSHADDNTIATEPDNSRINKRDTVNSTITAQDQARGSSQDIEMTRQIRERLTRDTALSTYAKNVKIVTLKGITTLRGPVANREESLFIERVARNISASVNNKLEVIKK